MLAPEEITMKKGIRLTLAILLILSLTTAAFAASPDADWLAGDPDEVAAVILHTNDVHVGLDDNIGYDGLALYKKELEAQYDHVLLVDAGDAIQGAAIGAISKGSEIIRVMNRLGYDLAIPGNHEFDFGFDVLDECAEQLACGYTCANFCTTDGAPVFTPWRILEAGNVKIGFVGAVTPDTFTRSPIKDILNEAGEPMYDFLADETGEKLSAALQKYIDETRENGADYVILVAHLGSDAVNATAFSSNVIVGMLTGLDFVIDGHSHEIYNTTIRNRWGEEIPIAQTGTKLQTIGQLTIYRDGRLEEKLVELVPQREGIPAETSTRKNVARLVDPDTEAYIGGIEAKYDAVMQQKIGELPVDLLVRSDDDRVNCRVRENGLCEMVADAYRAIAGTQAALINAGSVRTDLEAGTVTYKDALDLLPYCNEVITANVSGRIILDALEFGVSFLPEGVGAFPQVSGLTFTLDTTVETSVKMNEKNQFVCVDGPYRVSDVRIGGAPLDLNGEYTLATNMYVFTGGDGYTMFKEADMLMTLPLSDNEVVMKYISENLHGAIPERYAQPQGRIHARE